MSKFIKTDRGLVNLNHVALIESHETEEDSWVLSVNLGGEVLRVTTEESQWNREVLTPVVPAQPGYFTIAVEINEDGSPSVTKIPVVAWFLDEYGYLCPLNTFSSDNVEPVLYPDGRVYESAGHIWESEAAYINDRLQDVAAEELERGRISTEIASRYLSAERIESIEKEKAEEEGEESLEGEED